MLSNFRKLTINLKPKLQLINSNRFNSRNPSQDPKITVTNDGTTIVCWHEEQHFPYEHSRPIPQTRDDLKESESVLKIQSRIEGQNLYNNGLGPNMEELQMLTFTPKSFWKYGKHRRIVPKPPHPRKGV